MMNDIYEEDLVELTEEELEEVAGGKKKSVYVKVREANIRSGPGTEYSIVWGMGKGDELECVSKCITLVIMQEECECKPDGQKSGSGKRAYRSVWRPFGTL